MRQQRRAESAGVTDNRRLSSSPHTVRNQINITYLLRYVLPAVLAATASRLWRTRAMRKGHLIFSVALALACGSPTEPEPVALAYGCSVEMDSTLARRGTPFYVMQEYNYSSVNGLGAFYEVWYYNTVDNSPATYRMREQFVWRLSERGCYLWEGPAADSVNGR